MRRMKRGSFTVMAAVALLGVLISTGLTSAAAAPAIGGPPATGRAIIAVRTPALPPRPNGSAPERHRDVLAESRGRLDRLVARTGLDPVARSVPGGFLTVDLAGRTIEELREELASDPLVRSVSLEHRAEFRYVPNDPFLYVSDPRAPGRDRAGWNILLTGAEGAWGISKGNGAEVATIDSGAYTPHPELAGRISGTLNTCVPDFLGCQGTGAVDDEGHGTHVAGLACATADNAIAIASVGFGCSVYVIKTDLSWTSIINGIYGAVAHGSEAINMSFGGGGSAGEIAELRSALNHAWASGVIPVASGANTPTPSPSGNYPAQHLQPEGTGPTIDTGTGLVVTSAKHTGERTSFAQRTTGISVAAYGSATDAKSGGQQGILSTWPPPSVGLDSAGVRTTVSGDNRYAYLVGTSMATPQVAGLVALMKAVKPGIAPARLIKIVKQTATGCGTYNSTTGLGWGIVRADRAVAVAADKDVTPPGSNVRRAKVGRIPGIGRVAVLRLKRFDQGMPCAKDVPKSGVRTVNVFASANGGRYHRIGKTSKRKFRFRAKPGRRYSFYSVAVDKAKNREGAPAVADAKIRLKKR